MGTALLVSIVAAAAAAVWIYNSLVGLRNRVQNSWKQIDVQLKRRHDLIPNLVEAVKGAMEFERDTLTRVMEARARAVSATGARASGAAETELSQAIGRLFAVMENYPQLKSNENVLRLQEELTTTENQIAFARQYYNDVVEQFNTRQQVFPANVVANYFGFTPAEYFTGEPREAAVPAVDLRLPR
ncbi:LemA family protein [Candidatus Binatia bacterium]|nr:LemA family protein [Candidatus Binatia bacterium]